MKKLFLLIPALAIALLANAKVINVQPGNNTIRYAIAASTTEDGDVLVLADGTYTDDNYIEFNKSVEVRAADGATPLVQLYTYIKVDGSKDVVIKGIVFDGSGQGSYSYTIRQYNVNSLTLDGCEFRNMKNIVIYGDAGTHTGALNVNNCYFHNNQKQSIYFAQSTTEGTETCDKLTVTNSTFANTTALTDWRSIIEVRPYSTATSTTSDAIKVVIDHCTFYNNPCVDSGHANIRTHYSSDVTVSNCIFMHPTELAQRAVYCDGGGTVSNCLTYNFTKDTERASISYGCTAVNCFAADPLFTDAANGDFSFAGNWVTMALSPARGAATDGSDLGDPRWYSAEVLPSSNFVAPYAFVGAKAQIAGNLWYDSENNYMYYNDKSECGTAKWKIHATRACAVKATLNMTDGSSSGHIFRIEILDANGNQVAEVAETYSEHDGDIDLPNPLAIPAEGDYTVILHNDQSWSSAKINSITFAYIGGAIVTVPAEELVGAEAVLVNNGSLKVSKQENGDLKYGDNGTPLGEYVYWNINATKDGKMDVALNVPAPGEGDPSGHRFLVELYTDLNASPIASAEETTDSYATGEIALPAITLPAAGNYIVKLTNQKQWSSAILHSIVFTYKGGARATLPANFDFADALLSAKAHVTEGNLWFNTIGDSNPVGQWAKWNVRVAEAGTFLFTMNVSSTNGQSYKISILDMNENELEAFESGSLGSGDKEVKQYFNLAAGNYIVKLENTTSWSQGHIVSLAVTVATDVFVLDESTEDDGSIAAAAETGEQYTFLLKRSFTAGKYYTICLPVGSWNSELKLAFGDDYELWQMSSATQTGDEIDLNFEQTTSFSAGKPYIIKPSVDVKNPIFYNKKEIKNYTNNNVQEFTAADFVGTFYKDVIPAGESNLYLQNNNLYYSETNNTQIKGTRAWIRLKSQSGAAPKARIVLRDNTATAIDLVNSENKAIKRIENGQVVIIRDGQKYNVMGIKLQ